MMMIVEQSLERLARGTEVPGGNLPQFSFVHHKNTLLDLASNSGRRGGKLVPNWLSYVTDLSLYFYGRFKGLSTVILTIHDIRFSAVF
jgi:hypothetical protein